MSDCSSVQFRPSRRPPVELLYEGAMPATVHKAPVDVAVVGLGSGDTAWASAWRPETRSLTVFEISAPQPRVLWRLVGFVDMTDTRHLLEIALSALFWMTPILYPLTQVPEKLRLLILLSPLSPFVVAYQQMFFYQQWPSFTVWVVGLAYSIGTFLLGAWLFLSLEDRLSEQL